MPELDPEDAKLVTLARAARARAGSPEGAAVRDETGRTYAGVNVELPTLCLSALQLCVATAVSSGAGLLESAVLVTGADVLDDAGLAAVRDLGRKATVFRADSDGEVRERIDT